MPQNRFPTRQLVVIGLGLIGGSLAIAAKQRGLCQRVIGVARREEVCHRAVALGVVDEACIDIANIASQLGEGDVIFIAVPTLTVAKVLEDIKACVGPEVTITDGASVKGSVAADVQRIWGEMPANVVLGHPIAGSEKSGVEASNPELYERHRVILTPVPTTGQPHLARVTELWQGVGAEVLTLGVEDHDEILAATSHLPHVIAYSLVDTLAHDSQNQNIFRYAAGGFRDFTRIASSDAIMWRDIMLANKPAILQAIDMFANNLSSLRDAIEQEDAKALTGVFSRAKAARDHFTKMLAQKAYSEELKAATFKIAKQQPLYGELHVPGDKSISHRAITLAAIAEGTSVIQGFSESEDTMATIQAFRDLGVVIEGPHSGDVTVYGVGKTGLQKPVGPIYLGNSGTSMRLLAGLMAGQGFDCELSANTELSAKKMLRVIEPLRLMGAEIASSEQGTAPLNIKGGKPLQGITYTLPVASAQVKSAILLAGLYAKGPTTVIETHPARDHTERMLAQFGVAVEHLPNGVRLADGLTLTPAKVNVPGDFSAAMFVIGAVLLTPGSEVIIKQVGINPTRATALYLLRKMGAFIELSNCVESGGEPVADLQVKSSALQALDISNIELNPLQDEFPYLLALTAMATGESRWQGAFEAFIKDAARLDQCLQIIKHLGGTWHQDGLDLLVQGSDAMAGEIDCGGDAKLALAVALFGFKSDGVLLKNSGSIESLFPGYSRVVSQVGISLDIFNS